MKKILVVVPAFNESGNIANTIQNIRSVRRAEIQVDILVVNDGSQDNTAEIAQKEGAWVADLPFNLGIGGAVQTGFKFANEFDYDGAIQVDGDGQHDPKWIYDLAEPVLNNKADVVIGSRFLDAGSGFKSTFTRRIGIKIFSGLTRLILHQSIRDCTSGFRAYNRKAITFLAGEYPTDYPEPEAIIILGRNGFKISEVPVAMNERRFGSSSITAFRSVYYMIKVVLAILIDSIKRRTEH